VVENARDATAALFDEQVRRSALKRERVEHVPIDSVLASTPKSL
jgi:hypothetical protein